MHPQACNKVIDEEIVFKLEIAVAVSGCCSGSFFSDWFFF